MSVMGFFDVIELCQQLDSAHTNIYGPRKRGRHTTIYVCVDGISLRISHRENGINTEVMIHLDRRDDFALEVRGLHQILDDRLRKQGCMEYDILEVPF